MRTRCARIPIVLVAVLCWAACAPEQTLIPSTDVIVRVDASYAVRTQADAIRVRIASLDGGSWKEEDPLVYPLAELPWPLDLVVVLRRGSSAAIFELVLEAIDDSKPAKVLSQERRLARFEARRALLLEVALNQCGDRELGFVCEQDPTCHGGRCQSCVDTRCAPTPQASELPEWDGTAGVVLEDAAAPRADTGSTSEDGSADAVTNSPEKCGVSNGGCSEHATCADTLEGPVCSCKPGFEGRAGDGTDCVDKCATSGCNVDECQQTPSPCGPNSTCADTDESYVCTCASGYRDAGNGCELIDGTDCSPNPCLNGGACSDLVNAYGCECPAGFEGDRCERNIDDCASNSCTNGTCIDGVASYTCKCSAGYASDAGQKTCTPVDDCVGKPCGLGGVCIDGTNTYSCMCSSGFSGTGTKSCVNIDDCAAGNACTPGGTCVDGLNSYSCQCSAPVPSGVPVNSCRFTIKDGGIFDAQTGLSWSQMTYEIYKATDTPAEGCMRQGEGRRPPTAAEARAVIEFEAFNLMNTNFGRLCFATTTVDVCGPSGTTAGETHALRCVR